MTEFPGKNIEPDNPSDIFMEKFPGLQGKEYRMSETQNPCCSDGVLFSESEAQKFSLVWEELESQGWFKSEAIQEHTKDNQVIMDAINKIKIFKAPNPDYPDVRKVMNEALSESCKDNVSVWNLAASDIIEQLKKELKLE